MSSKGPRYTARTGEPEYSKTELECVERATAKPITTQMDHTSTYESICAVNFEHLCSNFHTVKVCLFQASVLLSFVRGLGIGEPKYSETESEGVERRGNASYYPNALIITGMIHLCSKFCSCAVNFVAV